MMVLIATGLFVGFSIAMMAAFVADDAMTLGAYREKPYAHRIKQTAALGFTFGIVVLTLIIAFAANVGLIIMQSGDYASFVAYVVANIAGAVFAAILQRHATLP